MDWIILLRWLHVIGACVLLGTGAGIAFFMLMAHRSKDARFIAQTANSVGRRLAVHTASAVVVQPITGLLLANAMGWPLSEGWVALSLALYVVTGALWLPVVWMQMRLRSLAVAAADAGEPLPDAYHRLFRLWFACGAPAFIAVLSILWLMVARPSFTLVG